MVRMHDDRSEGFTLIELMIVVAILGILASVAIPSFRNYQLTSKRAEAFANLSAIGKAQKSYFAEFNNFVAVATQPSIALGVNPGPTKRSSAAIGGAFADLGWVPDGDVFFDYGTNTPATPQLGTCTCLDACFTAAAYGNLDGDLTMSVLVYTHPDVSGNFCGEGLLDNIPPMNAGAPLFDQVARVLVADDY